MAPIPLQRSAIALGSNLGDRRGHLEWALAELAPHFQQWRVSSIIETEPVGVPDPQPQYLNAVAVGETALSAEALIEVLAALERRRGRERAAFRAARTLDLDLILHGDSVIHTPSLEVPHPRFRERRFVLEPLAEVASDWIDPVTGLTVCELLARLSVSGAL
jgi:2-amino-4-hydroxy-6-hydroxymethyldihydropteridine diphosphokinase